MRRCASFAICFTGLMAMSPRACAQQPDRDLLYVGVPNKVFANALDSGGVGIVAFDVKNGFKFVKRMPTWTYAAGQTPEAVRGIAASVATGLLYLTTPTRLAAFELVTDKMVWEKTYEREMLRSLDGLARRQDSLRAGERRHALVCC